MKVLEDYTFDEVLELGIFAYSDEDDHVWVERKYQPLSKHVDRSLANYFASAAHRYKLLAQEESHVVVQPQASPPSG